MNNSSINEIDVQERKVFQAAVEARIARNELQAAIDLAEERLKRTPDDLDARIAICRVWLLQGKTDDVEEMLREMEDVLAGLSRIYACMGDILMKKGLSGPAEEYYRKSTSLNQGLQTSGDSVELPDSENVPADFRTVTLAELYIRQGHLRQAEELLLDIIASDPQNDKASELLKDVRERQTEETPGQRPDGVIVELSRWLENLRRLRVHVA